MAEVLATFDKMVAGPDGVEYHAQACGAPADDGTDRWKGWVEFFPADGGAPLRSRRETTQPNRDHTVYWAQGLTPVFLRGTLERTLSPAPTAPPVRVVRPAFFLGGGIGLAMRGSAVLDGTEIAALLISKRSHVLKVGDVILVFNVVLFLAAMSVLGVESALYSILTYFTAARTLDFIIHGIEEYTAMTIVSGRADAIRAELTESLGRGVTVYRGYGGKSGSEQHILYCVVTRLEIGKVKTIVKGVDENAFIVSSPLLDVEGGVVKRAALH